MDKERQPLSGRVPRIVIIDDDATLLDTLRIGMGKQYEVLCADRPAEGLRLVENEDPDLVILDVDIPDMDGFAICETIRAADPSRRVPVLFLTAHATRSFVASGKAAGGDSFMSKPFDLGDLMDRIENLIAGR